MTLGAQYPLGSWSLLLRGISTPQCVDVSGWIRYGIQHDDNRATSDVRLYQRPPTSLWVVVPSVVQSRDANDRVQDLVCVEVVLGRQLRACGLADDKSGDPEGLRHTKTLEPVALADEQGSGPRADLDRDS